MKINEQSGLTLVEVLFAAALLVVIIVSVAKISQNSSSLTALAQSKMVAAQDAEKVMEEVRRVANTTGLSGTNSVTDASYWTTWIASQAFTTLPSESVNVTFPSGTNENPLSVLVQVSWSEKNSTKTYQLYNLVTQRF